MSFFSDLPVSPDPSPYVACTKTSYRKKILPPLSSAHSGRLAPSHPPSHLLELPSPFVTHARLSPPGSAPVLPFNLVPPGLPPPPSRLAALFVVVV